MGHQLLERLLAAESSIEPAVTILSFRHNRGGFRICGHKRVLKASLRAERNERQEDSCADLPFDVRHTSVFYIRVRMSLLIFVLR